jgi:hypothetical protein
MPAGYELTEFIEDIHLAYDISTQAGLLEFAADLAVKRFTFDDEVPPLFIFVGPEARGVAMVSVSWGSNRDKDFICARLGALFKAVGSPRYAMISEAWVATVDEHTDREVAKLAPAERSDRQEIVQAMACEPGHKALLRSWEIMRDEDAKATLRERVGNDGYEHLGGRMSEILD